MSLKRRDAFERWNDPEYLKRIQRNLETMIKGQCSLSRVDLSGIELGPLASIEAMKWMNLYHARLNEVNLAYASLSGSMSGSRFSGVNFTQAILDRVTIMDSSMERCDYTEARVIANMDKSILTDCTFRRARLSAGAMGLEYGGRFVKFHQCEFTDAVFRRVEFRRCEFVNCRFDGVEFIEASLRTSKFVNCSFEGARFVRCDIKGMTMLEGSRAAANQFKGMKVPHWAVSSEE